ncbi:hypothetical protein, partial [Bacillus toyonensis]|uniref:hypothetical protein n=1 Tax=Bacillus toyonensis TaxID=155322 RepID=UPI001E63F389
YSATRTGMAQKNELYIRDLGYFRLQDFKSIQDKQGYYLSRLKPERTVNSYSRYLMLLFLSMLIIYLQKFHHLQLILVIISLKKN